MKSLSMVIAGAAIVGIAGWFTLANAGEYEEPGYKVTSKTDSYEIRDYESHLVAEVTVSGDHERAMSQGFRKLAAYIFGQNTASTKMKMTVPVTTQSVKMKMTVPVTTKKTEDKSYVMRFVMEKKYNEDNLPQPKSSSIRIVRIPKRTVAALRYSGRATDSNHAEHRAKLNDALAKDGHTVAGIIETAVYDGPWTLPWKRRNEALAEIKPKTRK